MEDVMEPEMFDDDRGRTAPEGDPFEVLKSILGNGSEEEEERAGDDDVWFASVLDATIAADNPAIAKLVSDHGRKKVEIAEWVVDHKREISFSEDGWHLLCRCYMKGGSKQSLMIAETALEFFPYSTTLLGDALQAARAMADWEHGDRILEAALSIDMKSVDGWYMPVWISEYYRAKAIAAPSKEERLECLNLALKYVRETQAYHPFDDRVINQEAEILIGMKELAAARQVLDKAIFEPKKNSEGLSCHIMAPQCCVTYLDDILSETDEYDRIIEVANVGVRCSATIDRKVAVAYFFYRMALAMDCKITVAPNGYGNQELVRETLRKYALAYSLYDRDEEDRQSRMDIISERFLILSSLSGVSDITLDQFCEPKQGAADA